MFANITWSSNFSGESEQIYSSAVIDYISFWLYWNIGLVFDFLTDI